MNPEPVAARRPASPRRRLLAVLLAVVVVAGLLAARPVRAYLTGRQETRAASGEGVVVAAAGDIACAAVPDPTASLEADDVAPGGSAATVPTTDAGVHGTTGKAPANCAQGSTADLLEHLRPAAVLPLGDDQYECGSAADFATSYGASWGRFLSITRPSIGNHEYGRACQHDDPTAYFDYFGASAGNRDKGWYSYDLGGWHLIALNSECSYGKSTGHNVGGCSTGSPQEKWLQADLKAHPSRCTLAYWHEPRYSSGQHGDAVQMTDIWNDLMAGRADVVLSGHNHDYERFDPVGRATPADAAGVSSTTTEAPVFQDPTPDANGIREFVVGTGGKNHYKFARGPLKAEAVRDAKTFGVLALTLKSNSYDWAFTPVAGGTFKDSGTGTCH